jgi:lipid-A-disaccharide synthase
MGFVEVLFNLKTILGNIKICKNDIAEFKPDVIIFIDYPGFNMYCKGKREKHPNTLLHIAPNMGLERKSHH